MSGSINDLCRLQYSLPTQVIETCLYFPSADDVYIPPKYLLQLRFHHSHVEQSMLGIFPKAN